MQELQDPNGYAAHTQLSSICTVSCYHPIVAQRSAELCAPSRIVTNRPPTKLPSVFNVLDVFLMIMVVVVVGVIAVIRLGVLRLSSDLSI